MTSKTQENSVHFSSKTDEWATPQKLFEELTHRYSIGLDVCATAENAKSKKYYEREADGLSQEWVLGAAPGTAAWMNPPYGRKIGAWVAKAACEANRGLTIIALLPARTDTNWWHEYIQPILDGSWRGEVKFLRGRVKFGDAKNSAPFPSVCVIWQGYL